MNDIKDIVHQVVGDMASKKVSSSAKIENAWQNALDKKELEHTRLVGFRHGALMIDVDSSAWLYQMNMKKSKILAKLKQDILDIKTINFKVGTVK